MSFQLMAIWVKEVERVTFTLVLPPKRNIQFTQTLGEFGEVFLINRKGIVRVITLHVFCAHTITRETEPEITQAKIRPSLPARRQFEAQRFLIKGNAAGQAAYGESEMIEASQHEDRLRQMDG